RVIALYSIRAWNHAVYFGLDYHAVDVSCVAADGGPEKGRRVGSPQDYPVHALRDLGFGDISSAWYCGSLGVATTLGDGSRFGVSFHDRGDSGDRDNVFDVAGRANYRTRTG